MYYSSKEKITWVHLPLNRGTNVIVPAALKSDQNHIYCLNFVMNLA